MSAASSRYTFNRSVSLLLENLAAKRQLIGLLCSVTTIQGEDLSYSQMRYFLCRHWHTVIHCLLTALAVHDVSLSCLTFCNLAHLVACGSRDEHVGFRLPLAPVEKSLVMTATARTSLYHFIALSLHRFITF